MVILDMQGIIHSWNKSIDEYMKVNGRMNLYNILEPNKLLKNQFISQTSFVIILFFGGPRFESTSSQVFFFLDRDLFSISLFNDKGWENDNPAHARARQ